MCSFRILTDLFKLNYYKKNQQKTADDFSPKIEARNLIEILVY